MSKDSTEFYENGLIAGTAGNMGSAGGGAILLLLLLPIGIVWWPLKWWVARPWNWVPRSGFGWLSRLFLRLALVIWAPILCVLVWLTAWIAGGLAYGLIFHFP